jgi:hypothetical protein
MCPCFAPPGSPPATYFTKQEHTNKTAYYIYYSAL